MNLLLPIPSQDNYIDLVMQVPRIEFDLDLDCYRLYCPECKGSRLFDTYEEAACLWNLGWTCCLNPTGWNYASKRRLYLPPKPPKNLPWTTRRRPTIRERFSKIAVPTLSAVKVFRDTLSPIRKLTPRKRYNEISRELEDVPGDQTLLNGLALIYELSLLTLIGILIYAMISARPG